MDLPPFTGTLLLLCSYGLFKEIRPSEPYLTEYLTGYKGLDEDDVYQKVYPVWPYSYFALLVPVFLLTDLLRYKPVINFEGLSYVATWAMLLWADGVGAMQAMQFVYALATSTEVAYYTYIYAKVDKEDYRRVSAMTRSAILTGKFLSGLTSQVLDSTGAMSYKDMNYVSLSSVSAAFVLSLFLPPVKTSVYFHREAARETEETEEEEGKEDGGEEEQEAKKEGSDKAKNGSGSRTLAQAFKIIFSEAKSSYSKQYVVKWSVWVAVSTCLNFQVGNYIQPLWEEIQPFEEGEDIYNGAVEAATTLLGAIVVFAVGFAPVRWRTAGDWAILAASLAGGGILVGMGRTDEIWFAYVGYALFRMSYQLLMTVASFEIAKDIQSDAYGLIFGINTWVGLGLQTALTIAVADAVGLALPVRDQFVVYGSLYAAAGVAFAGYFIARRIFCHRRRQDS